MVSISRAAPDASRMCKVAAMISGPMPSPCATVMGVLLDIGKPKHIGLRRVAQPRRHQRNRNTAESHCLPTQTVAPPRFAANWWNRVLVGSEAKTPSQLPIPDQIAGPPARQGDPPVSDSAPAGAEWPPPASGAAGSVSAIH